MGEPKGIRDFPRQASARLAPLLPGQLLADDALAKGQHADD